MTLHLRLTAPAATINATDTETRTLAGIALPYGQAGHTSAGALTIDAGAVRVPSNLRAVKLFREHGRATPVGYAVTASDTPDALHMSFTVGRTPDGDQALLEAAEGLRDSLSVELGNVTIEAGHVTAADLVGVAQVAVPAFAGAVLTATDSGAGPGSPVDPESQPSGPAPDPDSPAPEDDDNEENTEKGDPVTEPTTTTEAAAPAATLTAGMVPAPRRTPESAQLWASHAADAIRGATDAAQVNAALADITPANSGSDAAGPPAWIGELWTPQAADRPLVDAIGVSPLTSMKVQGWKWAVEPVVAPYAGNKTEIPTSPASIVPAEATAQRIAGGWDLDRIYVDFNTGFLAAFQQAAVRDYRRKSQSYFIDGHPAVTGPPAVPAADGFLADATDLGSAADLTAALNMVIAFLTGNGARVSFLAMASDVFSDFMGITSDAAPWWLAGSSSVSMTGSANVGGTAIVVDPGLAAGTVLGGDSDAVSLWETGPINVQAVNLPNGGIDFALFGYWAQMVHDDDGLAKATVTAVGGLDAGPAADTEATGRRGKRERS